MERFGPDDFNHDETIAGRDAARHAESAGKFSPFFKAAPNRCESPRPDPSRPDSPDHTQQKDPAMRQLNRDEYMLLKAATRSLIKSCGGLEAAAMITRVGVTILSDYGNVEKAECFMPIDVAMDLQRETQCAPVTEALAALCGGAFVPQARERAPCGGLMESAADIMTQTADAIKSVSASLRDGRLTLRERTHMVRQIQEIIHACTEALLAIDGACQNSSEHPSER